MKSINRKVNALENNILQPMKLGTTKWYTEDEAECALFEKLRVIYETKTYNELTEADKKLVEAGQKRIYQRGIDLFCSLVGSQLHYDRPFVKPIWYMWLGYFLQEASIGLSQMVLEEEIMSNKALTWKQKEKALKPIYDEWVKPFSTDRFKKYISKSLEDSLTPEARKLHEKSKKQKKVKT